MKSSTWLVLLGVVLSFGSRAIAQQELPTEEFGLDYSLVRFTPIPTGGQARNLSGGGVSFVHYPNKYLGLKVDLQAYASTPYLFSIPVGNAAVPHGGTFTSQGNLLTYLGGPMIRKQGKWEPYAQVLLGAASSNAYENLFVASRAFGVAPSRTAFALTTGVGLNVHLSRTTAICPVEAGYLLTHFGNNFTTAGKNQNNFRYAARISFSF
jgi:hypothetical protein